MLVSMDCFWNTLRSLAIIQSGIRPGVLGSAMKLVRTTLMAGQEEEQREARE